MKTISSSSLAEWIAQEHPDVDAGLISDTIADWLEANRGGVVPQTGNNWEDHDGSEAFYYLGRQLTQDANKIARSNRG